MALKVKIKKKLNNFTLDMDFETDIGVFALLGASGCGKSVTLKCIAGIERPDEGLIELDGRVLYDSSKKINLPPQKRRVGYMFQDYALFPNMTVRKNVMTGMGKKPDPEKVLQILRRFRIEELADELPVRLSGGQKQRVAMARLVAQNPEVILLDEPFSALDSHLRWQLEQEMKEILGEVKKPVIFVSHSRDEVYHLCDTVCCISGGKAEGIETVREFFTNSKTRTGAILSGCKNVAAIRRIDAHRLSVPEWRCEFRIGEEIPEDIAYVGIRAHDFTPDTNVGENAAAGFDNCLIPDEVSVVEELFEWAILFRVSGGEWMQLRTAKSEMPELVLPKKIYLDSSRVMLLRG